MIKYRPHKGGLSEAMEHYKEFNTIDEMKQHIVDYFDGMVKYEDIIIGEIIGEDDRIGWKACRHVCTKAFGSEKYPIPQCIAWCDLGDVE